MKKGTCLICKKKLDAGSIVPLCGKHKTKAYEGLVNAFMVAVAVGGLVIKRGRRA